MKLNFAILTILLFSTALFGQQGQKDKTKTPAEVSADAIEEEPGELGMEEEDAEVTAAPDKSSKASGIGLDGNPLKKRRKVLDDEPTDSNRTEEMDEAADDILDKSFSQPGDDQNTGHSKKDRTGEANVAVPEKSAPTPTVELKNKESKKNASKQNIVITDKAIILKIQKALVKKGAKITADGVMSESTVNAIKEFQKSNGLKPDGSPGPKTLTKLGIIYIKK